MLLADLWLWAFLAALGWGLCTALVGSRALGRNLRLGVALVLLAEVPRAVLPLPFVSQPRIEAGPPVLIAVGVARRPAISAPTNSSANSGHVRPLLFEHPVRRYTARREAAGRRDGLDWWPAKGPSRPPGPGPPRTLPARSSSWLSSAPVRDDVEGPATDSTPGLDPRARPRGDLDTFRRCGHRDHLPDHRDASLARMCQHGTASAARRRQAESIGGTGGPWWVLPVDLRTA